MKAFFQVVLAGIVLSTSSLSSAQGPVPSTIEGGEQYTLTLDLWIDIIQETATLD